MQSNLVEFEVHPQEIEGWHPHMMYHRTKGAVLIKTKEEELALIAEGYSARYVHQEFPKMIYAVDGTNKVVADQAELETELAKGWLLTPVNKPIWDNRAPEPGFNIGDHHLAFLKFNKFDFKTVKEARIWFNGIPEEAKDVFLQDAENWIPPAKE